MLGSAFRKQTDIDERIQAEFPNWPKDPPVRRAFEAVCELMFPSEGLEADVPFATRVKHAIEIARRLRPSVYEQWGTKDRAKNGRAEPSGLTLPPPGA